MSNASVHTVSFSRASRPQRSCFLPLDFSSAVHPLSNSCTSSGSTSFLVHASSHFGLGGGAGASSGSLICFLDFVLALTAPASLLLNTREKNGILGKKAPRMSLQGYSNWIDMSTVLLTSGFSIVYFPVLWVVEKVMEQARRARFGLS